MTAPRDPTAATRQKASRARGRPVATTLRGGAAIAALARAAEAHGGIRAGLEAALLAWASANPADAPEPEPAPDTERRPRGRDRAGY